MKLKSESTISVEFPDENSARAAEKALTHEGAVGSRTKSKVKRNGKKIEVIILAEDVVAMRATINAFMREFQVFEDIEKGKEDV